MKHNLLALVAFSLVFLCYYPSHLFAQQTWTYDFGTSTGTHTSGVSTTFLPSPQTNGGTARVRVGNQGGQFELINTGSGYISNLGTGSQLQITAPTGESVNKFSIYEYDGTQLFYTRFRVHIQADDENGDWFYFQGAGGRYSDNQIFAGAQVFAGIRWRYDASENSITTAYRSGGSWVNLPNSHTSFQLDTIYEVEVFGNNSASTENYVKNGVSYTLSQNIWDLWLDGVRVDSGLNKALLADETTVDSFMFYGINFDDNKSILALDDITYSNYYPSYVVTLAGGECWRMLSSPVAGATYTELLAPIWTQGFPGANYASGEPNVLIWPDVSGTSDGSWVTPSNLNDVIPPGTGFIVSVYGDDNFDGTDDGFPKTLSLAGAEHTGTVEPDLNSSSSGWTLVGNPFGEPISFDFIVTNNHTVDLTDVAYVYDRNAGGWRSTNGTFGGITAGKIAAFQGFFVQNDGSSPSLAIPETAKTTGGTFFGKEAHDTPFVEFEVEGEGLINSAWVLFSEEGSLDRLRGDAYQLYPFSEDYSLLGSIKGDVEIFDIAQFPLHNVVEVPIYFESTQSGTYTITAKDFNLNGLENVIFVDTWAGTEFVIIDQFSYEFEHFSVNKYNPYAQALTCGLDGLAFIHSFSPKKAKASSNSRFLLKVNSPGNEISHNNLPDTIQLHQNFPNPFNPTTQIGYELSKTGFVSLAVYDITGRHVATLVNDTIQAGNHRVVFDASGLSSGVYMYRLSTRDAVLSRRFTLLK